MEKARMPWTPRRCVVCKPVIYTDGQKAAAHTAEFLDSRDYSVTLVPKTLIDRPGT